MLKIECRQCGRRINISIIIKELAERTGSRLYCSECLSELSFN